MGPSAQKPWKRKGGDVDVEDVREFWKGLSLAQRRELLRVDKATLFETVRKNLYCCKCHGLLVEGFTQLLLYNRTLQNGQFDNVAPPSNGEYLMNSPQGAGGFVFQAGGAARITEGGGIELVSGLVAREEHCKDPLIHPWGGLTATKDSVLTILDCFLKGEAPMVVFESSRIRERERELLYPDACGGFKGQGGNKVTLWSPGKETPHCAPRHHNPKESCALHKAKLSCEALVDFWGALGEETRASLLRMKEEDFIERLIKRFESKRFCRDCRRNVLKEFKEMKELRRARRETRCNAWFCMADTTLAHYEVTDSGAYASWAGSFGEDAQQEYDRFQWGLGTSEGSDDLFQFEDVGTADSATVNTLDLGESTLTPCWVSVRGWRKDGRCVELFAKASPVTKGGPCVHRRLWVGDGYVAINKGESIQRFFEKAEEADEDWMQEDDELSESGSDLLDSDTPRQQKHAKSPELARDFLLDAATVIFKEQVEKAFREGTARQNAHSIFVYLSLSLLEEKVKVACREIAALRKQDLLLLEEEAEKKEEEERKERKRVKDREKKQRRKEKDREHKEKEDASTVDAKSEEEKADENGDGEERGHKQGGGGELSREEKMSPGSETGGDKAGTSCEDESMLEKEDTTKMAEEAETQESIQEDRNVRDGNVEGVSAQGGLSLLQGKTGGVILDRQVSAVGKKVAALSLDRQEQKAKENGRQAATPASVKLTKAKSAAPIVSSSGTGGVKILVRSIPSVLANSNTKATPAKVGVKSGAALVGTAGKGAPAVVPAVSKAAVGSPLPAGSTNAAKGGKGPNGVHNQRIVVNATGSSSNGTMTAGVKVANGKMANGTAPFRSVVNGTSSGVRNGAVSNVPAAIAGTQGARNGLPGGPTSSGSNGGVLRAGPQVIRAASMPGSATSSSSNGGGTTTIITQLAPGVTVATKRPATNPDLNPAGGDLHGRRAAQGSTQATVTSSADVQPRVLTVSPNEHAPGSADSITAGARATSWGSGVRNPILNNKVIKVGLAPGPSNGGAVPLSRANSASAIPAGGYGQRGRSPPGPAASPLGGTPPVPSTPPLGTPPYRPATVHSLPSSQAETSHEPAAFVLGHSRMTPPYQNGSLLSGFQRSMSAKEETLRTSPPLAGVRSAHHGAPSVRSVIGSLPLDVGTFLPRSNEQEGSSFGARSLGSEGKHGYPVGGFAGQQPISSNGFKAPGPPTGHYEVRRNGAKEGAANGFPPSANGHIWGPDFSLFSFAALPDNQGKRFEDARKHESEKSQGEYSLFASAGGGFGFF